MHQALPCDVRASERKHGITVSGSEKLLGLLKEAARRRFIRVTTDASELIEDLALLSRQRLRHLDMDTHKLIALPAATQGRHAFFAQPESRAALRASRDLETRLPKERGQLDRAAERR